jgi:hypothetical protein
MRRPLNWFVVCISLLLLIANRSVSERKPQPGHSELERLATLETRFPTATVRTGRTAVEFGYVRTDGSFAPIAQKLTDEVSNTVTSASPSLQ